MKIIIAILFALAALVWDFNGNERSGKMNEQQKEAREHLADVLELDEGLTPWEVDFVENVSHWEGDFTPKQIATINKIYERMC